MKKIFLCFIAGLLPDFMYAQTAPPPYAVDFENVSKPNYGLDTVNISGYAWVFMETVVTSAASDMKNGLKAARLRNSSTTPAYMEMIADKPLGVSIISLLYSRSDFAGDRTGVASRIELAYSSNQGLTWLAVDTIDFNGIDTLTLYQSDSINIEGPVRIRLKQISGAAGKRVNIDDIVITSYVIPTHLYLQYKWPDVPGIEPSVDSMVLEYDQAVVPDSGIIQLIKYPYIPVQEIQVPGPGITVSGNRVVVAPVYLSNATSYHVEITEGAFKSATAALPNEAIADSSTWTFATADTIVPQPMFSLNETFTHCQEPLWTLGVFHAYNIQGQRAWFCSESGRTDSAAASMLGGIADGISEPNEDWLISDAPIDVLAFATPFLSFWQKRMYDGVVQRDVRISFDYDGKSDPLQANWEVLEVQAMTSAPAPYWTPVADINLQAYKHAPFYLAFTFACDAGGSYQLFYDDIQIMNEPLSIRETTVGEADISIIGSATSYHVALRVAASQSDHLDLHIWDIGGRKVHRAQLWVPAGEQRYGLDLPGLSKGVYFIQVKGSRQYQVLKMLVF